MEIMVTFTHKETEKELNKLWVLLRKYCVYNFGFTVTQIYISCVIRLSYYVILWFAFRLQQSNNEPPRKKFRVSCFQATTFRHVFLDVTKRKLLRLADFDCVQNKISLFVRLHWFQFALHRSFSSVLTKSYQVQQNEQSHIGLGQATRTQCLLTASLFKIKPNLCSKSFECADFILISYQQSIYSGYFIICINTAWV